MDMAVSTTPKMNSCTVRLFEMRAMDAPAYKMGLCYRIRGGFRQNATRITEGSLNIGYTASFI
jgi:hypothetical protein